MRQHLIILTAMFALIGWTTTANARTEHRSDYNSKPHHSKNHYKHARKHYKQPRKHYRHDRRHSNNHSYNNTSRYYSYGFRTDAHYGYYNNQRFYQRSHHGQAYYSNRSGYYFPNYGYIGNDHHHSYRCPSWHRKTFVTGVLLGALLAH